MLNLPFPVTVDGAAKLLKLKTANLGEVQGEDLTGRVDCLASRLLDQCAVGLSEPQKHTYDTLKPLIDGWLHENLGFRLKL